MTLHKDEREARKAELIARSGMLRAQIAQSLKETGSRLTFMRRFAAIAALVFAAGPIRALRLASRSVAVLGLIRRLARISGALKP